MTCSEAVPRLGEFLVEALAADEQAAIARHVEACAACAAALGDLGAIDHRLRAAASRAAPAPRVRGLAAAAVLAAALLVAGVLVLRHGAGPRLVSGALASAAATHEPGSTLPDGERLTALVPARVRLPGGEVLDFAEGARFSLGDDALAVETGEARVSQDAENDLAVATPFGGIRGKGASYRISITESTMNRTHVAVASSLVLTVTVIGGAIAFTGAEGATKVAAPHELIVREGHAETRDPTRLAPGSAAAPPVDSVAGTASATPIGRAALSSTTAGLRQLLASSSRVDQIEAIEQLLRAGTPEAARLMIETLQATGDPVLAALLEDALLKSPLDLSPDLQAAFSSVNDPKKLAMLAHILTELAARRPELQAGVTSFFLSALNDAAKNPERAGSASQALVDLGAGAVDHVAAFLADRKTNPEAAGSAGWVLARLSGELGDVVRAKLRENLSANSKQLTDPDLSEDDKEALRKKAGSLAWIAAQRPAAEHDRLAELLVDQLSEASDDALAGTLAWGLGQLKGLSDEARVRAARALLDSLGAQASARLGKHYAGAIGELASTPGAATEIRPLVEAAWAARGNDPRIGPSLQWIRGRLTPR